VTVAFFAAVAWLLSDEVAELDLQKIGEALGQISGGQLAIAAALTVVAYAVLAVFDVLARDYVGHRLPLHTTVAISFISYAFNFNIGGIAGAVGFPLPALLEARHRPGRHRGDHVVLDHRDVGGVAAGARLVLALPASAPAARVGPLARRAAGDRGRPRAAAHPLSVGVRRAPARDASGAVDVPLPGPSHRARASGLRSRVLAVPGGGHLVLAAAGAQRRLQRDSGLYLLSAMAGLLLHVPAGLGVFEAVFLRTVGHVLGSGAVVAMLLTYRGIYLLIPLAVATLLFFVVELRARGVVEAISAARADSPPRASRESLRP
jgi:hypothetical protein